MTKLCADAMGLMWYRRGRWLQLDGEMPIAIDVDGMSQDYDPLHDDEQAMALVKKFKLDITHAWIGEDVVYKVRGTIAGWEVEPHPGDLNRAICECVAKMHAFVRSSKETHDG